VKTFISTQNPHICSYLLSALVCMLLTCFKLCWYLICEIWAQFMQCYQLILWSRGHNGSEKYWFAYMWGCTWTLSDPRTNCFVDFCIFRGHLGVILKREIDPIGVIFRPGSTRHSISHTRKWLKQMRNQNVQKPHIGSLFRQHLSDLNQSIILYSVRCGCSCTHRERILSLSLRVPSHGIDLHNKLPEWSKQVPLEVYREYYPTHNL
jgi:hypothetical protein